MEIKSERMGSQLSVIAKWEHIKKLYEQEKFFAIRRLEKLTDDHLAPVARCVMKVSLAAQVMNHTAAAALYTEATHGKEQCLHSFCFHKK